MLKLNCGVWYQQRRGLTSAASHQAISKCWQGTTLLHFACLVFTLILFLGVGRSTFWPIPSTTGVSRLPMH